MKQEEEEKLIRELMMRSSDSMPFVDFEERLMSEIVNREKSRHSFVQSIRLSWFFFILGSGFGLFLSSVASESRFTFLGLPAETAVLPFQILFVLLFIHQIEKLFHLRKRDSGS
ncbi:MAG: hypothetical protein LWW85_08940 [Marinilabiliales bacterium]|nr:hypothetical protein [Marinilabiliales bacterium]